MFDALARRYDLGNDLLSLGLHRAWKQAAAREALRAAQAGRLRALDCACGSGDILLAMARQARGRLDCALHGLDFSSEMLEVCQQRLDASGAGAQVELVCGDVLNLQYADGSFDAATIGFGIRNVDDPLRGICEMARVVRPGGRVVVLETGQPGNRLWRAVYRLYGRLVMEPLGGIATGQREAYAYLNRTAASFPCGERFMQLMRSAKPGSAPAFSAVSGRALMGGIAWLYCGIRAGQET